MQRASLLTFEDIPYGELHGYAIECENLDQYTNYINGLNTHIYDLNQFEAIDPRGLELDGSMFAPYPAETVIQKFSEVFIPGCGGVNLNQVFDQVCMAEHLYGSIFHRAIEQLYVALDRDLDRTRNMRERAVFVLCDTLAGSTLTKRAQAVSEARATRYTKNVWEQIKSRTGVVNHLGAKIQWGKFGDLTLTLKQLNDEGRLDDPREVPVFDGTECFCVLSLFAAKQLYIAANELLFCVAEEIVKNYSIQMANDKSKVSGSPLADFAWTDPIKYQWEYLEKAALILSLNYTNGHLDDEHKARLEKTIEAVDQSRAVIDAGLRCLIAQERLNHWEQAVQNLQITLDDVMLEEEAMAMEYSAMVDQLVGGLTAQLRNSRLSKIKPNQKILKAKRRADALLKMAVLLSESGERTSAQAQDLAEALAVFDSMGAELPTGFDADQFLSTRMEEALSNCLVPADDAVREVLTGGAEYRPKSMHVDAAIARLKGGGVDSDSIRVQRSQAKKDLKKFVEALAAKANQSVKDMADVQISELAKQAKSNLIKRGAR